MVGRNRQPLAVGCVPVIAVFHPVTLYRQSVERLAVASKKYSLELSAMLYKFLLLGKKRLKITILAKSEQDARQRLQLSSNAICFARLNVEVNNG